MSTVLVADDEPDMRALLVRLLSNAGFDVIEAQDGESAVAMALEHLPDLIMLDLSMPIMGGIEALTELRQNTATEPIPVILLTAHPKIEPGLERLNATHVAKPWRMGSIERAVKKAIGNQGGKRPRGR